MDLYSSDFAGIQEGNMRTKSIENANKAVQEHNKNLGGQMASLVAQQKSADVQEQLKDATQQFWAMGKLPSATKAYKAWQSGETDFRGRKIANPTTNAQKQAGANAEKAAAGADEDLGGVKGAAGAESEVKAGAAALEDAGEGVGTLKKLGKFAGAAAEGAGALASAGIAGFDIYQDIESKGIAGDNFASKASNVLQIGGAIADIGATVFPPLALLGGVVDIAGGIAGEIGEKIDEGKEKSEDQQLQESQTEQTQAQAVQAPVSTGRVS